MSFQTNKTIPFPSSKENRLEEAIRDFAGEYNDESELLQRFIDLINDGCDEAFYYAGCIYESGEGNVEQDTEKALFYYHEAIERFGNLEAYLALGRMYFYGIGVEPDYDKAFEFYSLVERETSNGVSSFMLGKCYMQGLGVKKDLDLARSYFADAIDEGFVFGYKNMAALEKEKGNIIRSLILIAKASIYAFSIAIRNPKDEKLRAG